MFMDFLKEFFGYLYPTEAPLNLCGSSSKALTADGDSVFCSTLRPSPGSVVLLVVTGRFELTICGYLPKYCLNMEQSTSGQVGNMPV